MSVVIGICFSLGIIGAFLFIRNQWVFKARMQLLNTASTKAQQSIERGEDTWWQYYDWYTSLPFLPMTR